MRSVILGVVVAAIAAVVAAGPAGGGGAAAPRSVVGCDEQIGTAEQPVREAAVVLDRVGLPRDRYPWPLVRTRDRRFRWWGKWGALLRADSSEPVTVSVARPWRRHARIGWGNGFGTDVTFLPCAADAPWIAYAGGFMLRKRGCVPFDVRVGDRIERVRIAFGRAC